MSNQRAKDRAEIARAVRTLSRYLDSDVADDGMPHVERKDLSQAARLVTELLATRAPQQERLGLAPWQQLTGQEQP